MRTTLTKVLRGKPKTVTSDLDMSVLQAAAGFERVGEGHSATSPRPGKRAKCSAWAIALGQPGDCDQARREDTCSGTPEKSMRRAMHAGRIACRRTLFSGRPLFQRSTRE